MRPAKLCRRIINAFIILFLVVLFILCTPIGSLLSIGLEDELVRWEINNPYVNSNYSGWQEISPHDFDKFKIPGSWTIENSNGVWSIHNSSGALWALGTAYGTDADLFIDYGEFISSFMSIDPTSVSVDTYHDFSPMGGSDINRILFHTPNNTETFYYIKLRDSSGAALVFILFSDLSVNTDEFDIAEAIVYSYAYQYTK